MANKLIISKNRAIGYFENSVNFLFKPIVRQLQVNSVIICAVIPMFIYLGLILII